MNQRPAAPWTQRARLATAGGLLAGALLVVAGAVGASGEDDLQAEIPWLNVAVAGVILGGATVVLWLLAGRRAVTAARNRVVLCYAADLDVVASTSDPALRLSDRVTVAGSTWHHRPDCLLVLGKPLVDLRGSEGLAPCEVCGG